MIYGIGGIIGPIIGGSLVHVSQGDNVFGHYPYLLPNLLATLVLLIDLVLSIFFLEESLKEAQSLPPLDRRLRCLFSWLWQFTAAYRPTYLRNVEDEDDSEVPSLADACEIILPDTSNDKASYKQLMVPQIMLLLTTYGLFNLSNIAFNSLYPVYGASPRPTGRELSPKEIGFSLAFGGAIAIVFQGFLFTPLQKRIGSLWVYRLAFLGFVICFFAMPFVGRKPIMIPPRKAEIWAELGATVLIKNVAAVSGLSVTLLMITNASPKPSTLGLLNGAAQSLSAGGRAVGPLVSGALFSLSTKLKKDGEFLSWGIFGGVALVGIVLSCILHGGNLESDGEERAPLLGRNAEEESEYGASD